MRAQPFWIAVTGTRTPALNRPDGPPAGARASRAPLSPIRATPGAVSGAPGSSTGTAGVGDGDGEEAGEGGGDGAVVGAAARGEGDAATSRSTCPEEQASRAESRIAATRVLATVTS
jgi:hypothetical protein